MSECDCGKKDCATCCVDCNTGWIQADLREGNLNFRTTETNASNNTQGIIRDIDKVKSHLDDHVFRGFTAQALAESQTQQIGQRDAATTRLEIAGTELRQANIAAANAAVTAAAACRTDQLIQNTAYQTQRDLATGFCDLKTQLAKCCCDLEKLVAQDGVQTRTLIGNQELQREREANQNLRAELREERLACKIDKCCQCLSCQIGRGNGGHGHHHQPVTVG